MNNNLCCLFCLSEGLGIAISLQYLNSGLSLARRLLKNKIERSARTKGGVRVEGVRLHRRRHVRASWPKQQQWQQKQWRGRRRRRRRHGLRLAGN